MGHNSKPQQSQIRARPRAPYLTETQSIRNVAEAIERSLVGAAEGGHVEDQLWPACKAVGVRRGVFDSAIEVLEIQRRVVRSYDRIYVEARS